MKVRVLFFGILRDLTGKSIELMDLPSGATAGEMLERYAQQFPKLKELMPSLAVSINQEYATVEKELHDNDEIAFLPPVSGGSEDERLRRVAIVKEKIPTDTLLTQIKKAEDGAVVVFEGIVRNHSRGRRTLYLEYEAYEEMALKQMESLAEEALRRFHVRDAIIWHRLGRLEVGETSVLIVVASAHRAAAYEASRWLIDALKTTVPIWKRERFEDGAVWADGEPFPEEIPKAMEISGGAAASNWNKPK